jgi:hypothetical protein
VVATGYAGGFVGGLIAPWVRKAGERAVEIAFREAVKGAAGRTTQQLVALGIPQEPEKPTVDPSEYNPVVPQSFDVYLGKKEELDGCFAVANQMVQDMINAANARNTPADIGWEILNSFRKNCPLLVGVPRYDQLPVPSDVAKAAELAMWVIWTNMRDWAYWENTYRWIDDYAGGLTDYDDDDPLYEDVRRLDPVLERMRALGKANLLIETLPIRTDDATNKWSNTDVLDLRKLRKLRLQDMPDLPFRKMKDLSFWHLDHRVGLAKFLDGLRDLPPPYSKRSP